MAKQNMFELIKRINKESKKAETYNTGLLGEQMIVASYKIMPLDKLEKMRFIINKIIKQKKEFIRFANAQKNGDNLKSKDGQTIDKKEIPIIIDEVRE